jgi:hypothetical protein
MAMVFSGHFFWGVLSKLEASGQTQQTNLRDIVQNPDERVAVLKGMHHVSSSTTPE